MLGFKKYRILLVSEKNVTRLLSQVQDNRKIQFKRCKNCSWAEHPDMWFIAFECTDKIYDIFMNNLLISGGIIELFEIVKGEPLLIFK